MAVYETEGGSNCISFYVSHDLLRWLKASSTLDLFECSDLFPLATPDGEKKWVLYGADGFARIGDFDGYVFRESGGAHPLDYGDATYAGQTWNGHPQGKRVHIGWVRGMGGTGGDFGYEGMPFSQCMTVPCELMLVKEENGYRVLRNPVRELAKLRAPEPERFALDLAGRTSLETAPQHEYAFRFSRISGELKIEAGRYVIRLDAGSGTLFFENGQSCGLPGGEFAFRLLVDTTTMEFFFAGGIACTYAMAPGNMGLTIAGSGRAAYEKWELHSIWSDR